MPGPVPRSGGRSGPDRLARAHVFVASLDRPVLDAGDRHHLDRVLRLRPGDIVTVGDGAGGWRRCHFGPVLEPVDQPVRAPRPSPEITVAFVPVKGDRPEWAVQKLTELGVDRIVAFAAARSVVRWDAEKAIKSVERLRRVAREASMQSRRAWLPEVEAWTTFAEVARRPGAVLAHPDGATPWLAAGPVLIGPEGGWAPDEEEGPLPRMALGSQVLRSETAAVAAAALLGALRAGSLVAAPPPGQDRAG